MTGRGYAFLEIRTFLKWLSFLLLLYVVLCTNFFSNIGSLIASRGYFIPEESSLFTFHVTLENTGSGEYWLYGEDDAFYYYAGVMPYIVMAKDVPCPGLDKLDYRIWCGVAVPQRGN